MSRMREFRIAKWNINGMRWVGALLIAMGLFLPFARIGSGASIWVVYTGGLVRGEVNPYMALPLIWPLITAYLALIAPREWPHGYD